MITTVNVQDLTVTIFVSSDENCQGLLVCIEQTVQCWALVTMLHANLHLRWFDHDEVWSWVLGPRKDPVAG